MTSEPAQEGVDPGVPGTTQDVAWRRWGGGHGVPLVVLHGVTDDSGCWTPLAAGWSRGRTVIGVDARGHGATPLGDEGFTIAALARDVAAVVRAELAAGPAVVLGHSMGALVAQELALAEPDLVNSLVLEDPAWRRDRGATGSGCPEHVAEFVRANASRTLGDLIDLAPAWPPGEVEPWALAKQRVDPRLLEVSHEWDARDWPEALVDVQVHVTVIAGAPDLGSLVDPAHEARVGALLGDRVRVVRAVTGHDVRREARELVDGVVREVLAQADRRR